MSATIVSRSLPWILTLAGFAGLGASWALMLDKLKLLENPDFVAACDINTFITCTSVMSSDQAAVFGFPNQLLGIVGFTVVVTIGVLSIIKVTLPQWVLNALWLGALLGMLGSHWLAYHSIFIIHLLCPWCMVVWAAMILIFFYLSLNRLQAWAPENGFAIAIQRWHILIVALWFLTFFAAILLVFFQ